MRVPSLPAALVILTLPAVSLAQARGSGASWESWKLPAASGAGPAGSRADQPSREPYFDRTHGMMGTPGAAQDDLGDSRLGVRSDVTPVPSEGEWVAGDRVHALSPADVRAARQQQAPDLEWVRPAGSAEPTANTPHK